MELHIQLRSFADVCKLADLATAAPFQVRITDGRQWVDAKSLMCVFSLNLLSPLKLHVSCSGEEFEALRHELEGFLTDPDGSM